VNCDLRPFLHKRQRFWTNLKSSGVQSRSTELLHNSLEQEVRTSSTRPGSLISYSAIQLTYEARNTGTHLQELLHNRIPRRSLRSTDVPVENRLPISKNRSRSTCCTRLDHYGILHTTCCHCLVWKPFMQVTLTLKPWNLEPYCLIQMILLSTSWLKMQDVKMTDHQNCRAWNCRTWNCKTWNSVMGKSQLKSQVQITNHWQKWFKSKPQIKNQITNNQIKSKSNHTGHIASYADAL